MVLAPDRGQYERGKQCGMETLPHYRQVITTVLSDLAGATAQDGVETLSLFDATRDNYLLLAAGWDGVRRIHHIIAHLRHSQ